MRTQSFHAWAFALGLWIVMMPAVPLAAQNLAQNPGFESGTSGWFGFGPVAFTAPTNLNSTNWTTLTNLLNPYGTISHTNPVALSPSQLFFRARLLPEEAQPKLDPTNRSRWNVSQHGFRTARNSASRHSST